MSKLLALMKQMKQFHETYASFQQHANDALVHKFTHNNAAKKSSDSAKHLPLNFEKAAKHLPLNFDKALEDWNENKISSSGSDMGFSDTLIQHEIKNLDSQFGLLLKEYSKLSEENKGKESQKEQAALDAVSTQISSIQKKFKNEISKNYSTRLLHTEKILADAKTALDECQNMYFKKIDSALIELEEIEYKIKNEEAETGYQDRLEKLTQLNEIAKWDLVNYRKNWIFTIDNLNLAMDSKNKLQNLSDYARDDIMNDFTLTIKENAGEHFENENTLKKLLESVQYFIDFYSKESKNISQYHALRTTSEELYTISKELEKHLKSMLLVEISKTGSLPVVAFSEEQKNSYNEKRQHLLRPFENENKKFNALVSKANSMEFRIAQAIQETRISAAQVLIEKESALVKEKLINKINTDFQEKETSLSDAKKNYETIVSTHTEEKSGIHTSLINLLAETVNFKPKLDKINLSIDKEKHLGSLDEYNRMLKDIIDIKDKLPHGTKIFLPVYKKNLNEHAKNLNESLPDHPASYPIDKEFNEIKQTAMQAIPGLTESDFNTAKKRSGSILLGKKDVTVTLSNKNKNYITEIQKAKEKIQKEINHVDSLLVNYEPIMTLISELEVPITERRDLLMRQDEVYKENERFKMVGVELKNGTSYLKDGTTDRQIFLKMINGELFNKIKIKFIREKIYKLENYSKKSSKNKYIDQYVEYLKNAKNLFELIELSRCNVIDTIEDPDYAFYKKLTKPTGRISKKFNFHSTTKKLIDELHQDLNTIIANEYHHHQLYNEIKIDIYKKTDHLLAHSSASKKTAVSEHHYILWISAIKSPNDAVRKLKLELESIKNSPGTDKMKMIRMKTAIWVTYKYNLDKNSRHYATFRDFVRTENIRNDIHAPEQPTFAVLYQELKHNIAKVKTKRSTDALFTALDAIGGDRKLDDDEKITKMKETVTRAYKHIKASVDGSYIRYFGGSNLGNLLLHFLTKRLNLSEKEIHNSDSQNKHDKKSNTTHK